MSFESAILTRQKDWRRRSLAIIFSLSALCIGLGIISLCIGVVPLDPRTVLAALFGASDAKSNLIVAELRLPRTLLALAAGGATGMAGAALQGFLRNPLADAGVLGINAAAGLGAVCAIYFGLTAGFALALPLLAMAAAGVAMLILYGVGRTDIGALTLILTGMGIGATAAALISLAMNLSANPYAVSEMAFWLMGSVKNRTLEDVYLVAPFVVVGLILFRLAGKTLDALSLGEEAARSLGADPARARILIVLGVAAAIGSVTAVTGGIGFVGLVVPHLLRPRLGHLPSRLLWPSALGGAAFVLAADIGIRLASRGVELQLGVLTALIGAPFFIHLVLQTRKERA